MFSPATARFASRSSNTPETTASSHTPTIRQKTIFTASRRFSSGRQMRYSAGCEVVTGCGDSGGAGA